jgi:hypothetical protein
MRQMTKALFISLALAAYAPTSVAATSDDEWSMTIEAERWSQLIGIAIVAAGGRPPHEVDAPDSAPHLTRTALGIQEATARLVTLHHLTCRVKPIAKPTDCAVFAQSALGSRCDASDQGRTASAIAMVVVDRAQVRSARM